MIGELMETKNSYGFYEMCEAAGVDEAFLTRCLSSHWIESLSADELIFNVEDLSRLALIRELQKDFGVNDDAVPIILHLLDQLCFIRRGSAKYRLLLNS